MIPLERNKELLQKYLDLFHFIEDSHQEKKQQLVQEKSKRKYNPEQSPMSTPDLPNLSQFSIPFMAIQKRTAVTTSGYPSVSMAETMGIYDSQLLHTTSKTPRSAGMTPTGSVGNNNYTSNTSNTNHLSDHLSVMTSVADQTALRHEELCLVLLRGVMERLVLQLNPCQQADRETLPPSFTTQAKTYTANQWKDVMELAQSHSAECTIKIAKLYPQVSIVRSELVRMVVECPAKYLHRAECVMDYILNSDDETKRWLLYWTQPSLATVNSE